MDVCKACGKTAEQAGVKQIRACMRCYAVGYCCKECQAGDWKAHKKSCAAPNHADVPKALAEDVKRSTRTDVMGGSKVDLSSNSAQVSFDRGDLAETLASMARLSKFWLVPLPPHRPRALPGLLTQEDIQRELKARRVTDVTTSNRRTTVDASRCAVVYHYDAKAPSNNGVNISAMQFTSCLFDVPVVMEFV